MSTRKHHRNARDKRAEALELAHEEEAIVLKDGRRADPRKPWPLPPEPKQEKAAKDACDSVIQR